MCLYGGKKEGYLLPADNKEYFALKGILNVSAIIVE